MKQTENEMNVNVPLEVIKASEIEPKEVKWLWYPYIPFGKVTLLQGDPGDGKSKLMLSIAALLSKGEPLPFTETEENEPINSLADFVRCYEPVFLYLMAQKDIVSKRTETNRLKSSIESGKRRIQDLDKLIERIYEDQVLGNISAERYARMSVNYENEQRELVKRVDEDEKRLVSIEQTSLDLKILLKVLRSSTAFEELTPTLVNSLIRRIEVHNNDKSSGHCSVKVDIYFTAIGLIDIPTKDEIKSLMEKIQSNPQEYRLTA